MSLSVAQFLAEVIGTMILVLLGDGVVANVLLNKSKGQNAGWIVVTAGWAFAVTIAMACIGNFPWASVPVYITAQMIGAIFGATLVWLAYLPHWAVTEDKG